jgi:hypothetical protein
MGIDSSCLQRYLGADMLLDLLPVLAEPEKTVENI